MTRFSFIHRLFLGHWPDFMHRSGCSWRKRCFTCGRNYL